MESGPGEAETEEGGQTRGGQNQHPEGRDLL